MYNRIPGTKDILPQEVLEWQKLEEVARNVFYSYNYKEIRPPLIEDVSLFNRSLGQSSEIIQKQMFLINHGQDTYALRPEGTASIVRSYIENDLDKTAGFSKFYYMGPMFRLERPQKGRLRQFHHIGCEAIGAYDGYLDVEVISLADNLLKCFSIKDFNIKINSLGCVKDKLGLSETLNKSLKHKLNELCEDCNVRFKANILRVLDCKNEACQKVVRDLNIAETYLCGECKEHFEKVKHGLDALNIRYEVTPYLVRGLDYYTRTVFEISHKDLGAQDALGAGGRYDNLVKELGGPDLGAIGFAFGVERLLLVRKQELGDRAKNLVYLITLGEEAKRLGVKILDELRKNSVYCDTDYEAKSLKGSMRAANDLGARFALIIGDDEIKNNTYTLKDMVLSTQKQVKPDELIKEVKC
jgi:histidyl-tRNA synthetase